MPPPAVAGLVSGVWGPLPIVAWGDSLTQGGGFPALLAAALGGRNVVGRGLGGQGSYGIAARQGGRPLTVSVTGNQIPARQSTVWSWDFNTNSTGWYGSGISRVDNKMQCTVAAPLNGPVIGLGQTLANGRLIRVEFDAEVAAGLSLRCSGLSGGNWAANNGAGVDGYNFSTSGHHVANLIVGNSGGQRPTMDALGFLVTAGTSGVFTIDNIVLTYSPLTADYAVAVPTKNNNILSAGGAFTGTAIGTLAGVHGTMSTDASGNWTFTRDVDGVAVACPAGTPFFIDEAPVLRPNTNVIWAGNNGVTSSGDATGAQADIAAMVSYLDHSRYLVISPLTSSDHAAGRIAVIQQMQADLQATYGSRYVDIYGALRAAGDGSANDNADIAAGFAPRSLRSDAIHLNASGYTVAVATLVAAVRRFGG